METVYCHNDPCEFEATHVIFWNDGHITPLCQTCFNAFDLGTAYVEDGNHRRWDHIENVVFIVEEIAAEMGYSVTNEARHIIENAWAYDDLDEAIIQLARKEE